MLIVESSCNSKLRYLTNIIIETLMFMFLPGRPYDKSRVPSQVSTGTDFCQTVCVGEDVLALHTDCCYIAKIPVPSVKTFTKGLCSVGFTSIAV